MINHFDITLVENACVHQCPWCIFCVPELPSSFITEERLEQFLIAQKDFKHVPITILPRGEALLHPRLDSLLDILHKSGHELGVFFTNFAVPVLPDSLIEKLLSFRAVHANLTFKVDSARDRELASYAVANIHRTIEINNQLPPEKRAELKFYVVGDDEDIVKSFSSIIDPVLFRHHKCLYSDSHIKACFPEPVAAVVAERMHSAVDRTNNDRIDGDGVIAEACHCTTLSVTNEGRYSICCHQQPDHLWGDLDFSKNPYNTPLDELEKTETFISMVSDPLHGYEERTCRQCTYSSKLERPHFIYLYNSVETQELTKQLPGCVDLGNIAEIQYRMWADEDLYHALRLLLKGVDCFSLLTEETLTYLIRMHLPFRLIYPSSATLLDDLHNVEKYKYDPKYTSYIDAYKYISQQ